MSLCDFQSAVCFHDVNICMLRSGLKITELNTRQLNSPWSQCELNPIPEKPSACFEMRKRASAQCFERETKNCGD